MYFLKNKNLEATLSSHPFELISLKKLAKNIFINKIVHEKNRDQFIFQSQES